MKKLVLYFLIIFCLLFTSTTFGINKNTDIGKNTNSEVLEKSKLRKIKFIVFEWDRDSEEFLKMKKIYKIGYIHKFIKLDNLISEDKIIALIEDEDGVIHEIDIDDIIFDK